jgi:hypothetical protein
MPVMNLLSHRPGGSSLVYAAAMFLLDIGLAIALSGCTAMIPQYAAQQYAPSYYEGGYDTLTPQQKFQLEDHLSNQSNQAWQTTAQVMGGVGRLLGGTGSLIGTIRSMKKPSAGRRPRGRNIENPRRLAAR